MKSPTLKDVARLAGVSTATVSYIINGSRGVSEASRQKVEAAIKELSYQPNQAARNFKNGRHNSIGFIVPDIANMYFSTIIEEVETILNARGINLIVANTKETPKNELNQIRALSNGLVDGLIIASTLDDFSKLADILPEDFPIILIDRSVPNSTADQVLVSSETSMQLGVAELAAKKHTKIGYIAGLEHVYTTQLRIEEFKDSLTRVGITPDNSLIRYSTSNIYEVSLLTSDLLEKGCTAIVAGNNVITTELVNSSLNRMLSGKNAFQILGYSCGEWYSWLPFLRTIEVPTRDIGRMAIRRLLEQMDNPGHAPKDYVLTCTYNN